MSERDKASDPCAAEPRKPRLGGLSRQFTIRSVILVTTAIAIGLAVWKSFGPTGFSYLATATILAVLTVVLVQVSLSRQRSVFFATLIGSLLWASTRVTLAFFEDWHDDFVLEHYVVFCGIGALLALASSVHFKITKRARISFIPWVFAKPTSETAGLLILFGLSFLSLPILEWHKATKPEANIWGSYGSENGVQVYRFWGNGMNDSRLANCLQDIPREGKHKFIFRYTSVSDRSALRLCDFSNTVEIDIRGTRITDEGASLLHDYLPNCRIDR